MGLGSGERGESTMARMDSWKGGVDSQDSESLALAEGRFSRLKDHFALFFTWEKEPGVGCVAVEPHHTFLRLVRRRAGESSFVVVNSVVIRVRFPPLWMSVRTPHKNPFLLN